MEEKINVTLLSPNEASFEQAIRLYIEAIQAEAMTNYAYNFNHKNAKQQVYESTLDYIRLVIEAGNDVLVAKKGNEAIGIAILSYPPSEVKKVPLRKQLKLGINSMPLLGHLRYFHLPAMGMNMRLKVKLPSHIIKLEILAVSPKAQGHGIGKLLLQSIRERYSDYDGIYLTTGQEKMSVYIIKIITNLSKRILLEDLQSITCF